VAEALPTVVPWVRFLPAEDVEMMVAEFIATVQAACAIGNTAPVSQVLTEWRHTAEVHADPEDDVTAA
jgi:hypothetical protein